MSRQPNLYKYLAVVFSFLRHLSLWIVLRFHSVCEGVCGWVCACVCVSHSFLITF